MSGYLSFTRKERAGTLVLLLIIVLLTGIPLVYPFFIKQTPNNTTAFEKEIASLRARSEDSFSRFSKRKFDRYPYQLHYQPFRKTYNLPLTGELFAFDPNTLPPEGWKKLGIRDRTIITIQKYIAKGGHFYKPEDIGKIWGLHEDEVKRLMPYVQIRETGKESNSIKTSEPYKKRENFKDPDIVVNINTGDSSAFMKLPGIGSKLSNRIITFRNKLGGFYKIDQVAETYGLPDSTFKLIRSRLTMDNTALKQININLATLEELKAHPYIRFYIANAIIQYRTQHGNYTLVNDIKKIMMVTEEIYDKVSPYLKTE